MHSFEDNHTSHKKSHCKNTDHMCRVKVCCCHMSDHAWMMLKDFLHVTRSVDS